jgi:putative endonuclease
MKKKYYVYILANRRNGTIYTGFTSRLKKRIYEHKMGLIDGFTKKYNVKNLVYFEEHDFVDIAILREQRIKIWKRSWKVE